MKLKLTRTQKSAGMVSKSVVFMLDAQVEMTDEEAAHVDRYKLGSEVVYNSEKAKKYIAQSEEGIQQGGSGLVKGFAAAVASRMAFNITINDLRKGKHTECKDLEELMGTEEAIMDACRMLRSYLDTAATFDGREEIVDFGSQASPAA